MTYPDLSDLDAVNAAVNAAPYVPRADNEWLDICKAGSGVCRDYVIRRCLRLWSNPNDLVFSPFAGIGSEGYISLQMGRKFLGAELKRSYWEQAHRNLARAKEEQGTLFSTPVADDDEPEQNAVAA